MQSTAATVAEYLAELPADRRREIEEVRRVILKNLGQGFEEGMQYGMIGYYVPHRIYPPGYHCDPRQPLPFACLASQKNHLSLYIMPVYSGEGGERFRKEWAKTGKKLDMGKSCIRFKKADDLALELIGEVIRQMPVERWIAFYASSLKTARKRQATSKPAVKRGGKSAKPAKKPNAKAVRKKAAGSR